MSNKMKGIGDFIAKLTNFTGAKALVESVVGKDCGCDERQELMNEMLPFKVNKTDEDEKTLHSKALSLAFIKSIQRKGRLTSEEHQLFWDMYRHYVNARKKNTSCGKCLINSMTELERILTN